MNNEKVNVHIKYKDLEKDFNASLEETWLLLENFFREFLPKFEIANKLQLKTDIQRLAKDLAGIVAFSPEGANLLVPKNKLTDNEAILIWLLAQYLGNKLGLVENETLSKDELQLKLGKNGKITSTRLGELIKNDVLTKAGADNFRITTFGIVMAQKETIPKIKAKSHTQ